MIATNGIRVVVFQQGDVFVAQALEVDICAQGATREKAMERLGVAVRAEAHDAEAEGRNLFDIGPAPRPFHVMYESRDITRAEIAA